MSYTKNTRLEFSNHANHYNKYNIIQQLVSKALIRELPFQPQTILELGCGSGQVFKNIDFSFDKYTAVDFSKKMCELHPTATNLDIYCFDFDSHEFEQFLTNNKYDIVLSSSALQWSKNLMKISNLLAQVTNHISLVLFTSNTFKTIFDITNASSPILDIDTIKKSFDSNFKSSYETIEYKIEFDSKKELFDYIKNSGVGANNQTLDFKTAKKLYKEYPYNYLEFEVVFIKGNKI